MKKIIVSLDGKKTIIKGQVFHYGKKGYGVKSTIQEYNKMECSNNEITHLSNDDKIFWLKSYGLDSWNIQVE